MQYSIVDSSEIDFGDRIDAEYFGPSHLELEKTLKEKQVFPIRKYVQLVSSAFYPAATHLYEFGNIPFIRCVDCINYPVITSQQDETFEKIPQDFIDEYRNVHTIKENEIVITKVGSPCYASIISGIDEVALSRTVLGVKNIKGINPFYLTAFLRSKYGFQQLYRQRELTIQYQLTLDRVGKVLIFKPISENFENLIAEAFKISQQQIAHSKEIYLQAEESLMDELGLLHWRSEHQLYFVRGYDEIEEATRFDADYFQPKYYEVEEILSRKPQKTLAELCSQINYGTVPTSPYSEDGVPYIKGLNLVDGFVQGDLDLLENTKSLPRKFYTKENDIIISQMGTVGKAAIITRNEIECLFASFTISIRLRDNKFIDPYVLTLYINIVAREWYLLRRIAQASVRQNTDLPTIRQLRVPQISQTVQEEIRKNILDSRNKKIISKQLLEIAKRAVEIAIEQDESVAGHWLLAECDKLGVSLG